MSGRQNELGLPTKCGIATLGCVIYGRGDGWWGGVDKRVSVTGGWGMRNSCANSWWVGDGHATSVTGRVGVGQILLSDGRWEGVGFLIFLHALHASTSCFMFCTHVYRNFNISGTSISAGFSLVPFFFTGGDPFFRFRGPLRKYREAVATNKK